MADNQSLWDAKSSVVSVDAFSRLSRMVAGNDHLVTQPGLVQALFENNATPEQAQAINQFMVGLEAEQMVRTASGPINLSSDQRTALDAMGVDYSHVIYTPQTATTTLAKQMAAQGKQPVLDSSGNVQTDAAGNPLTQPLVNKGVLAAAQAMSGFHDTGALGAIGNTLHKGVSEVGDALMKPINLVQGVASDEIQRFKDDGFKALYENPLHEPEDIAKSLGLVGPDGKTAEDMRRQGYDPDSVFSRLAYNAQGKKHTDLTPLISSWDQQNPNGRFGWDGNQAVAEAEAYANDPHGYVNGITGDTSLTPEQAAAKIQAVSSKDFQDLVARVNAGKADVGSQIATGIGIDPTKHQEAFNYTAAGLNLATAILADPLNIGLGVYANVQRSAVALKNLADADGIARVFDKAASTAASARRSQAFLDDMVNNTNQLREAINAGDVTRQAAIHARIQANPFGGLVNDFLGEDQILGVKAGFEALDAEAAQQLIRKGDLPFETGKGEALSTYEKAVNYLASKGALLRLQGGHAPVEASVMPGALSSRFYSAIKGELQAWSAGRTITRSEGDVAKFIASAKADPGKLQAAIKDGWLTHSLPSEDDAVNALTGDVLATDALRGELQGNRLRYGMAEAPSSAFGKVLSIYTLGTAQRAKMVFTRISNWLPRSTFIDINQAESADTVQKMARTYMSSGDAHMLSLRWALGDGETRKTIVNGLKDQIAHAAGLTRTKAGREMIDKWKADNEAERYLSFGDGFKDSNGAHAAMYPGQIQTRFSLPSFGAIHKAASKIGLFEATMGRLMGSTAVERLMIQWKLGALFTPVTAMRANLEAWLNGFAEHLGMSGARAKALLRESGRLDYAEVHRSAPIEKILSFAPLQGAGRIYRHVLLRGMDEDEARAILEMPEDLLHSYIHDQAAFHYAVNMDPAGVSEITEAAKAGYRVGAAKFKDGQVLGEGATRKGFEITEDVNASNGANLYAHNLAMRVNKAPNVARAILERVENPELGADHVVAALESGPARNLMKDSLFGRVYVTEDGRQIKAVTDAEKEIAKRQWADKITADFTETITGRNGNVNAKIMDYIKTHDRAPDADWIGKHVKGFDRPQYLLKPIYVPLARTPGVGGIVQDILDAEGKGYQWMVERLIQRHSTSPLFTAAYAKSKVGLEPFKQGLIDQGFSKEAAERATASIAAHQGWERVARMLDDPHMKSQMDVVGRSFFAFSRATTMMLRRWGSTFWRNPQQARRLQLAAEGAVHAGLVYQDPSTGDWMFHFPASGVAQEVLLHSMNNIPGFRGAFLFPTADYTGRVASIIPGSSNPFQYNTNPIVSLSGRWLAGFMPRYREIFDEVDRKLNGDAGQGQGFWATLEPNLYRKVADSGELEFTHLPGTNSDGQNRDSVVASAMVGSLYNLYAAGQVPGPNASPAEFDDFLGRLETGTKNQLFLRAIFGAFSPATISEPTAAGFQPDAAFAALGAQGLRDEFKLIINGVDGDITRAYAIWTALHPDLPVYTESGSASAASRAVMPATQSALDWMNNNSGFIGKYKSVAAYFIPEQSDGEPYSQAAYRAQLEEGLRQRKTPTEFLQDAYIATAASQYYPMYDKYQADVAAAKAAGNEQLVAQHEADWTAWSQNFKARHLTFASYTENSAANIAKAQGQFGDLKSMVAKGDVPDGMGPALHGMVTAYENYQQFAREHPGTTSAALAARASAKAMLQSYLSQVVTLNPGLTDLYNGVFRPLSGYSLEATQ